MGGWSLLVGFDDSGERGQRVKLESGSGDFVLENEHPHVMITLNLYPWGLLTKQRNILKLTSNIWALWSLLRAVEPGSGWSGLVLERALKE